MDPTEYLEKCRHELQVAALEYARVSLQIKGYDSHEKIYDSLSSKLMQKELALDNAAMVYVDALNKMKKDYL